MKPKIHIFNPDTDYALASNQPGYTPPAAVRKMRAMLAILPAVYADNEDFVVCLDHPTTDHPLYPAFRRLVELKSITVLSIDSLDRIKEDIVQISPWGWNRSLLNTLSKTVIAPHCILPDVKDISKLRELSHRRTTIAFHKTLKSFGLTDVDTPKEFFNVEEALDFYHSNKECFFKAPWSSSGRGIMYAGDLELMHIEPWIRGIIKQQGSVMGEARLPKVMDFATEWMITDGKPEFNGVAAFEASTRGKYHFNRIDSQESLINEFEKISATSLSVIIDAQKAALSETIAPEYSGPVGIDMVVGAEGEVNPCIELNLRNTMGMVAMRVANQISDSSDKEVVSLLSRSFPENQLKL